MFKRVPMRSVGMKRTTRVFGGRVLRSGRRLFATSYEEEAKRARVSPVAVVDTQENRGELLDHGGGDAEVEENGGHNLGREDGNKAMEIDDEEQERKTKLGEHKKVNGNGTNEVMGIDDEEEIKIKMGESQKTKGNGTNEVMGIDDEEEIKIKMGESQKTKGNGIDEVMGINSEEQEGEIKLGKTLIDHNNDVSCTKQFTSVYTRKRKRTVPRDSSLKCSSLEEKCGSDKRYEKKYFKKVRTSLGSEFCHSKLGFDEKDVLLKVPDVSSSIGIGFLQDSTCPMSHGFFEVFGSILSEPFFTVDINALPSCFLYMHSSLLLKFAFKSYAFIMHPVDEDVMDDDDVKVPSIVPTKRDQPVDKIVVVRKARSARNTVPRISLFKKCFQRNERAHVDSIVPVPGVREIEGYAEEEYVPFMLPKSYICSRSDEVARTLEKSYPIYDMDSDDEQWLKKFNNERFGDNEPVSEDILEKIIDAFERGIYCSPDYYSDAASAIDRCPRLSSKEVLEAVYSYWMTKRKKKRTPLIRVFQCYRRKRVRQHSTNAIMRKKRSFRRRASQHFVGKQLDYFKAMLNDEKMLEEAAKAFVKVHEAQEAAKRAEAAAIVKRQEAQALMETADLVTYRATMALRIAEQLDE